MREDWIECEADLLGELIRGINYKKPQSSDSQRGGYLPILRANNIKSNTLNFDDLKYVEEDLVKTEQMILKGDIVFAMSSGSKHLVGKSGQAHSDYRGSFGAFCSVFRPNENIDPNYIQFYFHSGAFRRIISNASKGSNINNLKREHVLNAIIPLPSTPEQRSIVAKIEELFSALDQGIAELKKAQEQLKVYRQAVLKKAFEGELTKEWREQQTDLPTADELLEQLKEERQKHYKQQLENWKQAVKNWEEKGKEGKKPGKPKKIKPIEAWSEDEEKSLFKIAREWKWIRLVETVFDTNDDIVDGPFGSNLKNSDFSEDGTVPVIGISNIDEGFKTKIRYVTEEKFLTISRSAVYPGNIIVAKIGSSYGKTGIYPEWMPVGLIPANLLRIRPSKHYDRSLLVLYLKSLIFKRKLDIIMKSTAQPAYNVSAFKGLPVPFMSSQEQHQIVQEIESRLSVCDKVEESITESLEKAKALRQSILKKAFEGNLLSEEELAACKAAPDYEPASVLLERIKKEKK